MGLAVLVPVLGRPHRVRPLLEAFARTTPGANVYFIADRDDQPEHRAVREAGGNLLRFDGGFAAKINYAVTKTTEPLLFIVGDDVDPQPGWLDAARAHLRKGVEVVGVNDDIPRPSRPEHAVHFLITRGAAELPTFDGEPGPLCAQYEHWYVDDEYQATCKRRHNYAWGADAHVTHLHPTTGRAPDDATYRKGMDSHRMDGHTFHRRMRIMRARGIQYAPATIDVTIGVATFGAAEWVRTAERVALPSARAQGVRVIHRHADTLHEARNLVLADTRTEFVIHLDADDELEPGYVAALGDSDADLRVPSVRWIRGRRPATPRIPRLPLHRHTACGPACLRDGNYIVVGAAIRRDVALNVGGWEPFPVFEDWALWARCWKAGATIENMPAAIYRAYFREGSRNREHPRAFMNQIHRQIEEAIWGKSEPSRLPTTKLA